MATDQVVVTFDRLLQPGFSAFGNWVGVADKSAGFRDLTFGGPLTIAGATVSRPGIVGFVPVAGPVRISYLASPPDVISSAGAPAAAFADFPLTILP